jgi:hypothetical protein
MSNSPLSRTPEPVSPAERRRRKFVKTVGLIYLLLILEGIPRKWIVPEFNRYLIFLRDPFVLYAYWLAFSGGMRPKKSNFLTFSLMFASVASILVLIKLFIIPSPYYSFDIALYGLRNYFLYVPMPYLMARYFTLEDLTALFRKTLIISIPIAGLVIVQVNSPMNAPINQGTGTTEDTIYLAFQSANMIVRPDGPFSSPMGQAGFSVSALSIVLIAWLSRTKIVAKTILLASSCSVLTCLALSGSRGTIVWGGIVVLMAIMTGMLMMGSSSSAKVLLLPISLTAICIGISPIVFPTAIEAMVYRFQDAGGSQDITGRMGRELIMFTANFDRIPMDGFGVGIGGNGVNVTNRADPRVMAIWNENPETVEPDWGRHIVDFGPVLGTIWVFYRACFTLWVGVRAIKATRRSQNAMPILLFAFVAHPLFNAQMFCQNSMNGYGWLFAGLCLAASERALSYRGPERTRTGPPTHRERVSVIEVRGTGALRPVAGGAAT